jgi:hypothetical protein
MNFRLAARRIEADMMSTDMGMTSDWPSDRPTNHQPDVKTDGLDPASIGGPAPFNNGVGPYGEKVVTDPLVPVPDKDQGGVMPHIVGPDVDTTTLKSFRERG